MRYHSTSSRLYNHPCLYSYAVILVRVHEDEIFRGQRAERDSFKVGIQQQQQQASLQIMCHGISLLEIPCW